MFRKLSQFRRFLLIMGMMMGMSIVGCAPEQPARQASPPSASQPGATASQAECQKLQASLTDLERSLQRMDSGTALSRKVEENRDAALQALTNAKCP